MLFVNFILKKIDADIWYISKYAIPYSHGFGTRHFGFSKIFIENKHKSLVITSNSNHILRSNVKLKNIYNYRIEDDIVPTIWIKTLQYKKPNSFKRILSWIDFEIKLFFLLFILKKPNKVIISSLSIFTVINGYLIKKLKKAKFIFEVRDIWPLTLTEIGNFNKKNFLIKVLNFIEKFGYKNADCVIGTMPNLVEHVNKLGVINEVHCIPQGFFINHKTVFKKFNFPKKFIICYAGGIGLSNALKTFIDCSIKLKNDENIFFVIAGDGKLKNKYENLTKNNNNILFLGHIEKKYIQSLLKQTNVLYDSVKKSSLYDYGLSRNKWIDYMRSGKPIIASFSGYKSMINESKSGSFIEPENVDKLAEEIYKYYNLSEFQIKKMGNNAREWVNKNRTYSNLASSYLKIINE